MNVLLTGASGFVGQALGRSLLTRGYGVRGAVRHETHLGVAYETVPVGEIHGETDWSVALRGMFAVVHLAARVHVMRDASADPLTEFRKVNVEGTLNLAHQAAAEGVKRFVYLSSIKVNGEVTTSRPPFTESDVPSPQDAYALSKWEAEQGLMAIAHETGMEVVIIRPPLVYGPGVKANFEAMMRWLYRGVPLPFGSIDNRRSLLSLDNLVDFIALCLSHPAAANEVFLVSDGEDFSTTSLLRRLGDGLGKPARLLSVPSSLLMLGASILGKRAMVGRLLGSLCVDIGKSRALLGWSPPCSVDEALLKTAEGWLRRRSNAGC